MPRFILTIALAIAWVAVLAVPLSAEPLGAFDPQHVLIINSYHKGYQWTDEQSESALSYLLKKAANTTVDVVYMDWKRFPRQSTIDDLRATLAHKYADKRVDLIVTGDDAALEFAMANRQALFQSAPVVFMSIFESADARLTRGESGVTGVYETIDLEGTIEAAMKTFPSSRRIYIIHDDSETSRSMEADINSILDGMGSTLERHVLGGLIFEDLLDALGRVESDSIVLLASYARDPNNLTLPPEVFARQMSERCPVPLFVLYTHMMGTGAFGGSLLDGNLQGQTAGALASRVLSGESVGSIPRVRAKTVYPCFDYAAMKRFGVEPRSLPKGSVIINKPFSFFESYSVLVIGTSVAFAIMAVLIAFLFVNVGKRRRAQTELARTNAKLQDSATVMQAQLRALNEGEERLRKSEAMYRLVSEASRDVIWQWDLSDTRVFPPRFHELLGYEPGYISSQVIWRSLIHPDDIATLERRLEAHIAGVTPDYQAEFRLRKRDGEYLWFRVSGKAAYGPDGRATWLAGSYTDITEERRHQDKLDRLAFFDSLTGLPNRVKLRERVEHCIDQFRETGGTLAMLFIDMDNFKYINDSFGHLDGDKLLVEAGRRLTSRVPEGSFVSRLGGDEFIVVIAGNPSPSDVGDIARDLHASFIPPFEIDANRFYVTFSMGIVTWPKDGLTFDELLKNADTALYSSKAAGKSRFAYFDPDMNRDVVERGALQNNLHQAIENAEFFLQYQPQVRADTLAVRGFEALARWRSPTLGLVAPTRFIPACEESGQIIPLGNWILETACARMKRMVDAGHGDLSMSVNISAVQLSQGSFVDIVKRVVESSGIAPRNLELEITESVLIDQFESNARKLGELSDWGVRIALDDFGTGYSSLNYLRKLPLSTLKIDKSFIDALGSEPATPTLIDPIIDIARLMRLEVVAEGVETEGQRTILAKRQCHWIQGYLVSKPLGADEADRFLADWNPNGA